MVTLTCKKLVLQMSTAGTGSKKVWYSYILCKYVCICCIP